VSRGLGPAQLSILYILEKAGGASTLAGILVGLDKGSTGGAGTREYNVVRSSLSRSLKALRARDLVQTYTGVTVAGRAVVVVALTTAGAEVAREIVWE
jgi:DNA-binding MarR family transcriptional regulator